MEILFILIYQPIYNILIGLYDIFGDFGIAIIVMTIAIKLLLVPLSKKQIESQKEMQELQPKIKELQKKYKDDKEQLSKKTMALYKEHKINPAAGCLPLIIQMIIFITMYRVIINLAENDALTIHAENLYSFIPVPEVINGMFLGIMNLAEPSILLAVITAAAQFYQLKMMQAKTAANEDKKAEVAKKDDAPDFATIMQKQMLFIVPIMTLFIGIKFPSGLALYWLTSTVFMIAQQWYIIYKEKMNSKEIKSKTK
ncbi:MAG: YidC/Oxa1 family membrane protein insertase [Candidatus Moraniibacteriota bacterium]|jgi:YidC/Oxa1 family membrane protein insertase